MPQLSPMKRVRLEDSPVSKLIATEVVSRDETTPDNVDTPPPTPEVNDSRLDLLKKLKEEYEELSQQVDILINKIVCAKINLRQQGDSSLEYDIALKMVDIAHLEIRDQLNLIYNPGQELGANAASLMKEVREKQRKRMDKMTLELCSLMDQAEEAIQSKREALVHEIQLHERTLSHQENQQQETEAKVEKQQDEKDEEEAGEEEEEEQEEEGQLTQKQGEQICSAGGTQSEDCVILVEDIKESVQTNDSQADTDIDGSGSTPAPRSE